MQRGRYRQFAQIGLELLGADSPAADVEVLLALHAFLAALGFDDLVILLNNLGDPEDRPRFIAGLKGELQPHRDQLCSDCQRRWDENPLRILDCKVPRCRELVADTTPVAEVVSEATRDHVDAVEAGLAELGIPVRRSPRLVRGLDYYLRTVFEVISPGLGEDTVHLRRRPLRPADLRPRRAGGPRDRVRDRRGPADRRPPRGIPRPGAGAALGGCCCRWTARRVRPAASPSPASSAPAAWSPTPRSPAGR